MITAEVRQVDDYQWGYREGSPKLVIGKWTRAEFDPFPGYRHDQELVERTLARVMQAWPPGTQVVYWLPKLEELGRTNGFSCRGSETYTDGVVSGWTADVLLSGKRIPLHPAVTRYLVAHEYGHHVEWWLEHQRGMRVDSGDILAEYAQLRGFDPEAKAHGGQWHEAACEIFADDFRVMCVGVEPGHWPHPTIEHPYRLDSSHPCWSWWDAQRAFAGELEKKEEE